MSASKKEFLGKYAIYFVLLGMIVLMTLLTGRTFLNYQNLINIVRQMSVIGIISMGALCCIILSGTDLSSGSVLALVSVVVASLVHPAAGGGAEHFLLFALAVAIGVGALTGLINGCLIAYGEIPAFIATLSMMLAARGMALFVSGGKPIGDFTEQFEYIGGGEVFGVLPMPIIIFAVMATLTHIILSKTYLGTHIYAIGGNENAAKVSGINVKRVKIFVYTFAGICTAVASIVLTSRISSGQPGAGVSFELDAIASVVIGGTSMSGGIGTVPGTIVGVLIMGVLTNAFTILKLDPNLQLVAKGAIIAIAVYLDVRKNKAR